MSRRERDPIAAAQGRCQRRRAAAGQYGWPTEAARAQVHDLYALAAAGATTAPGRNAEAEDREHRTLIDLLADRAHAYAQLVQTARLTEQEIAP